MQGRRPTPTLLKLINGNPGKRPLRLEEFRPAVEIPAPPEHIRDNPEAIKEWRRITKLLAEYGLVSKVDRAALVFYVVNWARHCEAEDMIRKAAKASGGSGLFVKTPNDFPVQSPWLAVSNKAMEMCKTFLNEFGMTPAARTRVQPSPQMELPGIATAKDGFNAL
jgi:P27 family predicted phage terminase small subunit